MAEFRDTKIKTDLLVEDNTRLMKILDTLPLIFQGLFEKKGRLYLSNSENLGCIVAAKNENSAANCYVLEPDSGFGLRWILDSYLVNNGEFKAPTIISSPESGNGSRSMSRIDPGLSGDLNCIINVYNSPRKG